MSECRKISIVPKQKLVPLHVLYKSCNVFTVTPMYYEYQVDVYDVVLAEVDVVVFVSRCTYSMHPELWYP